MIVIILMNELRRHEKREFFAKRRERPLCENGLNRQRTFFSDSKNLLIAITEEPERSFNAKIASLMSDRVAMVWKVFRIAKVFFRVMRFVCRDCRMLLFGKKLPLIA